MKQNYFLFFVALGIVALFNSCKVGPPDPVVTIPANNDTIPANSLVYPRIPTDPGIIGENGLPIHQIVVDLGGLEIDFDTIIPNVIVESCKCGDPDIKLLTLPDNLDVETAVAAVRESDDDSNVKADKNFKFGFFEEDRKGVISDAIVNANSLDLGFIQVLDAQPDIVDPVIAIVDSGIFPNAFQENEITLFKSSVLCNPNTAGWNFVDDNDDVSDDIKHGTFVAKRIAKRIKELDISEGKTTKYKILPLKVFSNGLGEYFDMVCAFSYIKQLVDNGVQIPIINASFGSSLGNLALTDLLVLKKYIDDLNQSTIIVASAGNEGVNNALVPHFPSGYSHNTSLMNASINPSKNIVAVAGYELIDTGQQVQVQLAPKTTVVPQIGSNFGELNVDLAAPWAFQMEEKKKDGQTIVVTGLQGTSYSAAYVSGDLLHFFANQDDVIDPQNPIQGLLDAYYSSGRINMTNNIQVIDGKFVK